MKARIIVLEDDEDTLEVLSIVLQDEEYEVHQRDLLIEDLTEVVQIAPDVMLVDLFMGDKRSSWQLIQRIKAHHLTEHIPIVICTAGKLTTEQILLTRYQRIPIMYKPFDLNHLILLVESLTT